MATFKFTRTSIQSISPPAVDPESGKQKNQELHWDSQTPGFGLRITKTGVMSFIFETRIHGKKKRITIGKYIAGGMLTPERARKEADKLAFDVSTGGDPIATKRRKSLQATTLEEGLKEYMASRKSLKPSTKDDMRKVLNQVMPDWLDKPLTDITADMVVKRHTRHGTERSEAKANAGMRYLRAIFNYAMATYTADNGKPVLTYNPVQRLSATRSWYENKRRQTVLLKDQLPVWLKTVLDHEHEVPRDYLLLVLFTGLRKNEALQLLWRDVNLVDRTLTVRDTKNKTDHTLPLSDFLYELLDNRYRSPMKNEFVFPGKDLEGHFKGPDTALRTVSARCGFHVSLHDLRRTFATIADSLDIPAYALKALLNHKNGNDVTAGYVIRSVERLRKPMERISQYILSEAKVFDTSNVVSIASRKL